MGNSCTRITNESYPSNDKQFNVQRLQQKREDQNDFTARRFTKFAPLPRMLESENTRGNSISISKKRKLKESKQEGTRTSFRRPCFFIATKMKETKQITGYAKHVFLRVLLASFPFGENRRFPNSWRSGWE